MPKYFNINDFMDTIGLTLSSTVNQTLLNNYQLPAPAYMKDIDGAWIEKHDLGLSIKFEDEGIVNIDPHADKGDGELIYIASFFENIEILELPFGILSTDDKDTVLKKMPKDPDNEISFLRDYIWLMESPSGKPFMFSFAFDSSFKNIYRVSISYIYEKIDWIEELKNKHESY